MGEKLGRSARFGKYFSKAISMLLTSDPLTPNEKKDYDIKLRKLLAPDFETRKKDEPRKPSHKSELENISYDDFNVVENPRHMSALIREAGHLSYNAHTANRTKNSYLKNL